MLRPSRRRRQHSPTLQKGSRRVWFAQVDGALDLRNLPDADNDDVVEALLPTGDATATLRGSSVSSVPAPLLAARLVQLDVSDCPNLRGRFAEAVSTARSLKVLKASNVGGGLEALPTTWAGLSLTALDFSRNRLHRWPAAVLLEAATGSATRLAAALEDLDLSSNRLVDAPASAAVLCSLRRLDLRDNCLRTIDDAVFQLGNLERLSLAANPELVDLSPAVAAFVRRAARRIRPVLAFSASFKKPTSALPTPQK